MPLRLIKVLNPKINQLAVLTFFMKNVFKTTNFKNNISKTTTQ